MFKRKRSRRWVVLVFDNQTGEHLTTHLHFARSAQEAGDLVGYWLDLEGFEIEARLEVGEFEPHG